MGYFGSEFTVLCNHYGVMAAWSRKTLKMFENFLRFFGKKTTHNGTIFQILFGKFSPRHRSMCCFQISWNFAWFSSCHSCADRAQNLPRPAPDNVLRVFQISFKSVHFRRSYSKTRAHCQNAPWNESNIRLKPTFEPNNYDDAVSKTQQVICHKKLSYRRGTARHAML